ncbi:unnamed protein product [Amoebophrya sp. A25]|nr:unnamed protein product [Amoebophrya sp. A25]|eukprot:GSA25T00017185001.1
MREAATSSAVMNADDGQRSSASSQRAPEQGATQGIQQEGSGRRGATRSSSSSAVGSSARSAAASSARSSARMHEKSIQPVVRPHAVKHNHATVVKEMGIQPLNMQKVQSQKSAVDNLVAGATQLGNGGAGAMTMTIPMKAPPPAPAIPGSAVGSNVSRPV